MENILNCPSVKFLLLSVINKVYVIIFQSLRALQEAQIPCQNGRNFRKARRAPDGKTSGLQNHHARWEQRKSHELHCQRAGECKVKHPVSPGSRRLNQKFKALWKLWPRSSAEQDTACFLGCGREGGRKNCLRICFKHVSKIVFLLGVFTLFFPWFRMMSHFIL